MAEKIRIAPEQMRSRASEFKMEASNIESIINSMDKLLSQLEEEWDGEASKSFAEQYIKLRPAFVNGKQLVTVISTQLEQVAGAMENLDSGLAKQFGQQ